MRKVLVTGKSSYIGEQLKKLIKKKYGDIDLKYISVRNKSWEKEKFNDYDVLLHLAGIAHVSRNPKQEQLYYKVNRDLTFKIAQKAKKEGIPHFIFMSSIIVFGDPLNGQINKDTRPSPTNFYGESKLQAESLILDLMCENFKVSIIRPPMVYGENSKGNYSILKKYSKLMFLIPSFENKRSVIHVDNLSEFLVKIIKNESNEVFHHPQDKKYISTTNLIKDFSFISYQTKLLNPLIEISINRVEFVKKMFGNLTYNDNLSEFHLNYHIINEKKDK